MNASTEIIKYTIVIIQSLKDDDLKTGEMLYDRLFTTLPIKYPDTSVKFYNVKDKRELAVTFYKIFNEIENGELVTLQIETHGCEEGIELASGELVIWKEFFGVIRPRGIRGTGTFIHSLYTNKHNIFPQELLSKCSLS